MQHLFKLKIAVFILSALFLGFLIIHFFLSGSYSKPFDIVVSNISDHQLSISWITQQPTTGEIVISPDGKYPLFPELTQQVYKDDGDIHLPTLGYYLTHQVTLTNLAPATKYYFRIYQGRKKVYAGSFMTAPTLSSIQSPNPIYGRVVLANKKSPVVGALVYLEVSATDSAKKSTVLSALTNSQGRWSLDLANLRSSDLKSPLSIDKNIVETLIINDGKHTRVRATSDINHDQPWPTIILK